VIRAAHAIRSWKLAVGARGIRNTSHIRVLHAYPKRRGIENRAMQHKVTAVIAMVNQRKGFPFDFGYQEYEHPPTFSSALGCPLNHTHGKFPAMSSFCMRISPPNYEQLFFRSC
jgi:hypothetical protein